MPFLAKRFQDMPAIRDIKDPEELLQLILHRGGGLSSPEICLGEQRVRLTVNAVKR